jgi:periplasmic protein TonB
MFAETISSSWDERSRRGATALASMVLQALAVGLLLIFPLLQRPALPSLRQVTAPVSLGETSETQTSKPHAGGSSTSHPEHAIVLRPSAEHSWHKPATGDGPASMLPGSGPYIPGTIGPGTHTGIQDSPGLAPPPIIPRAPAPKATPLRVSEMSEGDLVHKVLPAYPPLARSARIQGQVILQATISAQGTIENLRVLYGHPMLVPAAIEAVRQWRYRPYILNHEPVEVETQITVNFSLGN